MTYDKIEDLVKHGNAFNIIIRHEYRESVNKHNWCLYVIIFPSHPLYKKACKNTVDYDTDLGDKIYPNFHCGCTYYNKQFTYVKIGCDYMHVGDEEIWHENKLPAQVDLDAEELYEYFDKYSSK